MNTTMKKNKIFWITSWPKSGNTLLRTIMASIFFTADGKFDDFDFLLNKMSVFESALRLKFLKIENNSDFNKLSDIKILSKYWLDMQSKGLHIEGDFCFLKTHSAFLKILDNPFTNNENTHIIIIVPCTLSSFFSMSIRFPFILPHKN